MKLALFPVLRHPGNFDRITDDPVTYANFCRGVLGLRFASHEQENRAQTVGDEIVTWRSDNRAHAGQLQESRNAPAPAAPAPARAGDAGHVQRQRRDTGAFKDHVGTGPVPAPSPPGNPRA